MIVADVLGARRVHIGPAAGDGNVLILDLQVGQHVESGAPDHLRGRCKDRVVIQVLIGLPGAAGRARGPVADELGDLRAECRIQAGAFFGFDLELPDQGRENSKRSTSENMGGLFAVKVHPHDDPTDAAAQLRIVSRLSVAVRGDRRTSRLQYRP
jgi:hypothetical protein